jgi:hypothetical protein
MNTNEYNPNDYDVTGTAQDFINTIDNVMDLDEATIRFRLSNLGYSRVPRSIAQRHEALRAIMEDGGAFIEPQGEIAMDDTLVRKTDIRVTEQTFRFALPYGSLGFDDATREVFVDVLTESCDEFGWELDNDELALDGKPDDPDGYTPGFWIKTDEYEGNGSMRGYLKEIVRRFHEAMQGQANG